jgi:hypothetical protein
MSMSKQPSAGSRNQPVQPADLDGLLSAYFKAEMPEPWPELKLPPPATAHSGAPRRPSLVRSRLVLAASLLLLATGPLYLSGMFANYRSSTSEQGTVEGHRPDGHPPRSIPRFMPPRKNAVGHNAEIKSGTR